MIFAMGNGMTAEMYSEFSVNSYKRNIFCKVPHRSALVDGMVVDGTAV